MQSRTFAAETIDRPGTLCRLAAVRVVVSAGEASGRVMLELFRQGMVRVEPGCEVLSLAETSELGPVFGFAEGLRSGPALGDVLGRAEDAVARLKPDVVMLVSFSGLHLPLGRRLRARGLPVLYLGPPQVWAWGGWRKRRLRRAADKVVCLFKFEEELLRRAGVASAYFGYPLFDSVKSKLGREEVLNRLGLGPNDRYVVFLPGSRPAEMKYHVPLFKATCERVLKLVPDIRAVMVTASPESLVHVPTSIVRGLPVVSNDRYEVMRHAECACAVSGTVTAELALLGVPMVVCYHLPALSRMLARLFVRTRYFALPNILAGGGVVPEELEPGPDRLAELLEPLTRDSEERKQQVVALRRVAGELGPPGAMARICRLAAGHRLGEGPGIQP
jgi:lipid-A-disaccharide synthase